MRNNKKVIYSVLLIFLSIGLLGCFVLAAGAYGFTQFALFFENQTRPIEVDDPDEFYSFRSGNDFRVIPLVQPYQVMSIDGKTWIMKLHTNTIRYQDQVSDIETVAVIENGPIILYAIDTLFSGERVDEVWFVVDPQTMDESGFTAEADLENYLASINIDGYAELQPDMLYEELLSTGTLYWFP